MTNYVWIVRDIDAIVATCASSDKAEQARVDHINKHFVPEKYWDQISISKHELT